MEFSAAQLEYLNHLNIDVWVPRDMPAAEIEQVNQQPVQSAANESPIPPQSSSLASSETNRVSIETPVKTIPNVSSEPVTPLQDASKPLAAPAFPQADPAVAAGQSTSAEPAPQFDIQFWCYSSGLWVVTNQVDLLPEHHKFVHNVAAFVQGKKRKPRHVGIFSWPMLDSPNVDQGPSIAIKHLNDHIQRLTTVVPVKKIVAFGNCDQWFPEHPIVSCEQSIPALFMEPATKKQLWHMLLPHQISD